MRVRLIRPTLCLAAIVALGCLFGGCAAGSYSGSYAEPERMALEESAAPMAAKAADLAGGAPPEPMAAPAVSAAPDAIAPEAPAPRLRIFSAEVDLSASNREESRNRIIVLAEEYGGYTESSSESSIIIRVPAARFDDALGELEGIGRVLNRTVSAADVTDQYTDLENRLRIARTSRDRLLELLERSDDPEDQVRILREIRRLAEEIEQIESSLRSLENQIAYSRISIRFISPLEQAESFRKAIPFSWIADLDPLVGSADRSGSPIEIAVPGSFAVFDDGRYIEASSARGVRFRAGAVENDPVGDSDFWQRALAYHLAPLYRHAETVDAGPYRGVLLTSKEVSPFFYLVMVRIRGDEIILAEAFFPSAEEKETTLPLLLKSLEEDQS